MMCSNLACTSHDCRTKQLLRFPFIVYTLQVAEVDGHGGRGALKLEMLNPPCSDHVNQVQTRCNQVLLDQSGLACSVAYLRLL